MYPYLNLTFNVTRETKLATVLCIDNTRRAGKVIPVNQVLEPPVSDEDLKKIVRYPVNEWFLDAIYVESNSMRLCKCFNLPSYDEVDQYMQREHPELCAA